MVFLMRAILAICILASTQQARAEAICVSSLSEHARHKSKLPNVLQELPTLLTVDSFFLTAGLKIRPVGEKLKLEGYVWQPGDIYADDGYIRSACYENNVLKVTLDNGKTYEGKVNTDKAIEIKGFKFKQSTERQFANIVEKVRKASNGKIQVSSDKGSEGIR